MKLKLTDLRRPYGIIFFQTDMHLIFSYVIITYRPKQLFLQNVTSAMIDPIPCHIQQGILWRLRVPFSNFAVLRIQFILLINNRRWFIVAICNSSGHEYDINFGKIFVSVANFWIYMIDNLWTVHVTNFNAHICAWIAFYTLLHLPLCSCVIVQTYPHIVANLAVIHAGKDTPKVFSITFIANKFQLLLSNNGTQADSNIVNWARYLSKNTSKFYLRLAAEI